MVIFNTLKRRVVLPFKKNVKVIPQIQPIEQNLSLSGKTALITGGSGGIGLAIAEELANHGCRVVIGGTNSEKLSSIKAAHPSESFRVAEIDYSDIPRLESQLTDVIMRYGSFDYFVSSAGVHTNNVSYDEISVEEFDRVLDINLKGTYFAVRAVAKSMIDSCVEGKIVLVSSSRGLEPAWSPYGISKWGINGMTEGFAQLLSRHGISVNAIAPGTTATPLVGFGKGDTISSDENEFGRMAMPEEVAGLVRAMFLEGSNLITGEVVSISGGRGRFDIR